MHVNPKIAEEKKDLVNQSVTPGETTVPAKAEKKTGKRIGYNYIILKSLKESQKNDVVKCLYIKSLTKFGICVIKEGTYGDSKDREGRDIKDRLMWQKQLHELLADKVRLPKLLGSFEENGNYYLVIERIKGKSLYKACKEKGQELREGLIEGNTVGNTFLGYMVHLVDIIYSLHQQQVVHRDVSLNNFMIMPSGKMAVIDMELSYSLGELKPSPPFQLGTVGYMSPQQESLQSPSMKDDIFSIGAILLQMWTSISPIKLIHASMKELVQKIYFLIPDKNFAEIIIQCLDQDPENRPTLQKIREVIIDYKNRRKQNKNHQAFFLFKLETSQITDIIQQSIVSLSTPLFFDSNKGWFSEDAGRPVPMDKKKINKAWYASFYKGAAGVLYTLAKAKQTGFDISSCDDAIQKALEVIETKYISRINEVSASLHYGSSGIAASLSSAIIENVFTPQVMHFDWINQLILCENSQLNYMSGIAGQGMANWICQPFLQEDNMHNRLHHYVNKILLSQSKDGVWHNESKEKGRKATRGFARGNAGIIYFLLEYAIQYQDRQAMNAAIKGLEWLKKMAIKSNDTVQWRSSTKKKIDPWWCEGAPGIALAFMKAYAIIGEPEYKKYATGALLTNSANILHNNFSQCHGLAGLGELYLEAHTMLKEDQWIDRARWIAEALMHLKKLHPSHGPYWLVEDHERQPTADFMSGNSGVIHFLLRFCQPDQIGFPLMEKK